MIPWSLTHPFKRFCVKTYLTFEGHNWLSNKKEFKMKDVLRRQRVLKDEIVDILNRQIKME
ncbi:MAG: hypothetical protein AAFX57_10200, partial [Bacteroidota bacterium]